MVANRAILSVRGADAGKLLHSLCTNDVAKWLGASGGGGGLAAAFLTGKGRILAETLLWRPADADGAILVDCPADAASALLRHLKTYKLRSKAKIAVEPDLEAAAFSTAAAAADAARSGGGVLAGAADPRTPLLGGRGVARAGGGGAARVADDEIARRAYALGVPDGASVAGRIPLNCNLDYLNYVSFDKGCYLGQELTARAKFRGDVRRRLMPVALQTPGDAVLHSAARAMAPDDPVPGPADFFAGRDLPAVGAKLDAAGKGVGELVAVDPRSSVAIAMVKLDFALSGEILDVDVAGEDLKASPYVPPWWPSDVDADA